jgi:hypothetical protein
MTSDAELEAEWPKIEAVVERSYTGVRKLAKPLSRRGQFEMLVRLIEALSVVGCRLAEDLEAEREWFEGERGEGEALH